MADQTPTTIPTPNPIPNHTTNRRQLLTGASALALSGMALTGAALAGAAAPGSALMRGAEATTPLLLDIDPAYLAYVVATEAEGACNSFRGDEETGEYDALYETYSAAERKLGATPAASLIGLRGKMERLAADQYWEPDDCCHASCLGLSLLGDLRRMAIHAPFGWPMRDAS